jgi:hypothetical protein
MSRQQACEYFEWFVKEIPKRVSQLRQICPLDLDFSPDALVALGDWFGGLVETRQRTHNEMQQEYEKFPTWLWQYITNSTFTEKTLSMCIDLGIYFGETLHRRNPALRWDVVLKPKNDVDFHQPVILPFRRSMHLNPTTIMINVAATALRTESAGARLQEVFRYWDEMGHDPRTDDSVKSKSK